jgi:drug/metabolite transporter (DMT)-like permease
MNKTLSGKWYTYVNLILAMIFWGFTFIWTKQLLPYYRPITIILLRLIIATAFLYLLNLFLKQLKVIDKRDFWNLLLISLFQPTLYFICENYGLMLTSTTVTAVIVATIPLLTPVADHFIFRSRISKATIIGLIVSFVGVCMVVLKTNLSLAVKPLGLIILLAGVVTAVAYTAVVYRYREKYNSFTILFWQNLLGIAMLTPVFLITDSSSFIKVGIRTDAIAPLLLLSVVGSALAYIFYINAIRELGITIANLFTNTVPICTAVFAFIVLGERLSVVNMVGIGLTVFGVLLSQIKRPSWRRQRSYVNP